MTITASEYEYGNPLTKRTSLKKNRPAIRLGAIVLGLIVLAAAIAEAYAIWRMRAYIIRLNSFRAFDALMAPPDIQQQIFRGIGISEVILLVWVSAAWLAALLLGLSGLWTAVRRRYGWRMLWTGAIATVLAGVLTIAGGHVLEHYAGFPPQAKRIYAIAFLIHSAPGWGILGIWLIWRLFLRNSTPRQQPDNPSDATAEAPS